MTPSNRLSPPRGVFVRHPSSLRYVRIFELLRPYTMVPYDALLQMERFINDIEKRKVPGAIVETGCWRGGCGAFMAKVLKNKGATRPIFLFDSFEGFPTPGPEDEGALKKAGKDAASFAGYNTASYEDAQQVLKKLDVEATLVRGWFKDTVPARKNEIGKIALLRLDGDLYESTKTCLEGLYDQVADGGIIVVDDFGFSGCRKALYEFFAMRGISPEIMNPGKNERAYFIKRASEER